MDGTVGAYEAKTHLAALLDRVENGETLTITRNGRPVARLVPAGPPRPMAEGEAAALVGRFRELREKLRAAGVRPFTAEEIVDLVHAGRKY
ncbi:MAG: type II toxin-antitoxin system prevent-host-death family antitoxin [Acetobacteraceae bacterium]|nr:type II toxin-antitoxin system prevent-host-death family antitoxin [Acetobacteraceae bacterium]